MYEITKHTIKALNEAVLAMEEKQDRINDLITIVGEHKDRVEELSGGLFDAEISIGRLEAQVATLIKGDKNET